MIKYIIIGLFSTSVLSAQSTTDTVINAVEVGDIFEIGRPAANEYKHINFPKPNFIIKKGGIANYKKVEGNTVFVTSIKEQKNGTTKIKMKRTDGTHFFGTHPAVTADFTEAVSTGELLSK